MPFFNSITLVGYVATDPINRQTSGGKDLLSFRMSYKAWGGAKESAFINVTIWGRPAVSVGAFLEKGHSILVHGHIEERTWQGNDGVERTSVEISGSEVQVMQSKGVDTGRGQPYASGGGAPAQPTLTHDEEDGFQMPF